jgi:glycosyltransferase involved in cell wall biosynthesis
VGDAEKRPLFSICIPNYNYGRFIADTVHSVLDQSFQDFEIVVVDNASTDDSVERVEAIGSAKVRLFRNRYNIGFAPNLQQATRHARGEFVNLLSSDDQMQPGALEAYAEVIEKVGPDRDRLVLMSDADGFDNEGRTTRLIRRAATSFARRSLPPGTPEEPGPLFSLHAGHDVLRDRIRHLDTVGVFCSITYSRSLWEAVEGYNAVRTIGPDKHFNYKLLSLDPVVAYVHRPLYRYRDYVSDNRAAVQTTIRHPIDDYLNVLEFGNESFLGPLGLTRDDLVEAFVRRTTLDALTEIALGNGRMARRMFWFAMSTFPVETLKVGYAYGLMPLLALGPIGTTVAPPLRRAWVRVARREKGQRVGRR